MDCIHLAWALKQVLTQAKENSLEIEKKEKRAELHLQKGTEQ